MVVTVPQIRRWKFTAEFKVWERDGVVGGGDRGIDNIGHWHDLIIKPILGYRKWYEM